MEKKDRFDELIEALKILAESRYSPWMTLEEAGRYLKLSTETLKNYTYRGVIPYYKQPLTGTKRFHKDELDAWIKKGARGIQR